jgi:hypothetical protein
MHESGGADEGPCMIEVAFEDVVEGEETSDRKVEGELHEGGGAEEDEDEHSCMDEEASEDVFDGEETSDCKGEGAFIEVDGCMDENEGS